MSYFKSNTNLIFSFIFVFTLAFVMRSSALTPKLGIFPHKYVMHIIDALPDGAPPLKLRCHTLNVSEEYRFKFYHLILVIVVGTLVNLSQNVIGRCKRMVFILQTIKTVNLYGNSRGNIMYSISINFSFS
ncbi:hypothetical protein P3L10_028362 [Capsicum annuum]